MKFYKRILSSFFAVVIMVSAICTPYAQAALVNDVAYYYTQSSWAPYVMSYSLQLLGVAGDVAFPEVPGVGTFLATCADKGINTLMEYYAAGYTDDDYYTAESDYVSTLDSGLSASSSGVTVHGAGFENLKGLDYANSLNIYNIFNSMSVGDFFLVSQYGSASYYGGFSRSNYTLDDGTSIQCMTTFIVDSLGGYTDLNYPLGASVPLSQFSVDYGPGYWGTNNYYGGASYLVLPNQAAALAAYASYPYPYAYLTPESYISDAGSYRYGAVFELSNLGYIDPSGSSGEVDGLYFSLFNSTGSGIFCPVTPRSVDASETYHSGTRISDLAEMISDYNKTNSYQSNPSAVNYYIGIVNDDGSSDLYDPSLYDEETLIFTEPISGTQYQTTGWTYDYTTRSYDLTLASGTMTVADTDITQVICTYGDDAVTISYCDSSGAAVQTDEFAYVMASQSECNINGHTYNVETAKEPTCTAAGERTYTCSVCGNQYVEEIPTVGHAYEYSIYQAPTCTSAGIGLYTCSTCGDQYTEQIPALGHDWLPTSITDESWAVPDDVHCPSCSGTTYSYDRSDYEVVLGGKNYFDLSVLSGRTLDRFVFDDADSFVLSFLAGNGFAGSKMRLRELAPYLVVGRTYTLSFDTESSNNFIFLGGFDRLWFSSTSLTMTDEILDSQVVFYGMNSDKGDPATDCRISNIQIELGTEATSYEPYREDEIVLIPPIYHFTCDDCSNTWDAEAVYQYAYTTFTCSRCDETMIQSEEPPMEEQDWFLDFGDTITSFGKNALKAIGFGVSKVLGGFVDLIGGIFGFLDETIIGGVKDFFFSLSDSSITDVFRQENSDGSTTIALPDGMASVMSSIAGFFTGLPTEIRGILTFGIAFLFLVAALMLML